MRRLLIALIVAALSGFFVGSALAAPAAILTGDFTGQRAFNDPIVAPGVRSSHEHCFYGVSPVNQTETEATLRDADHSSRWDLEFNRTAVWIPCVYENGIPLGQFSQHGVLLYYKSVAGTECAPPDNGAQGVSHEYGWRGQIGGGSFSPAPPATSSDGALVLDLVFRGERDFGLACFPTIEAFFRLNVGAGPIGNITIGGPIADVDGAHAAGEGTEHGDYKFAHDRAWFDAFRNSCLIPGVACGRNPRFGF